MIWSFSQCNAVRRARPVYQSGSETSRDLRASTVANEVNSSGNSSAANVAVSPRSTGNLSVAPPFSVGTQITYETAYDIHGNSPCYLIDLNASGFSVSRVTNSDVIHAKRSEVPQILKVSIITSICALCRESVA